MYSRSMHLLLGSYKAIQMRRFFFPPDVSVSQHLLDHHSNNGERDSPRTEQPADKTDTVKQGDTSTNDLRSHKVVGDNMRESSTEVLSKSGSERSKSVASGNMDSVDGVSGYKPGVFSWGSGDSSRGAMPARLKSGITIASTKPMNAALCVQVRPNNHSATTDSSESTTGIQSSEETSVSSGESNSQVPTTEVIPVTQQGDSSAVISPTSGISSTNQISSVHSAKPPSQSGDRQAVFSAKAAFQVSDNFVPYLPHGYTFPGYGPLPRQTAVSVQSRGSSPVSFPVPACPKPVERTSVAMETEPVVTCTAAVQITSPESSSKEVGTQTGSEEQRCAKCSPANGERDMSPTSNSRSEISVISLCQYHQGLVLGSQDTADACHQVSLLGDRCDREIQTCDIRHSLADGHRNTPPILTKVTELPQDAGAFPSPQGLPPHAQSLGEDPKTAAAAALYLLNCNARWKRSAMGSVDPVISQSGPNVGNYHQSVRPGLHAGYIPTLPPTPESTVLPSYTCTNGLQLLGLIASQEAEALSQPLHIETSASCSNNGSLSPDINKNYNAPKSFQYDEKDFARSSLRYMHRDDEDTTQPHWTSSILKISTGWYSNDTDSRFRNDSYEQFSSHHRP